MFFPRLLWVRVGIVDGIDRLNNLRAQAYFNGPKVLLQLRYCARRHQN